MKYFQRFLFSGGTLLGISAILSKFLGLARDRLLLDIFGEGDKTDLIFASFRVPDFFFFLLIGGTVTTLFLPRASDLNEQEEKYFFSSFLWGIVFIFGFFCLLGVFFAKHMIPLFAGGFSLQNQEEMIPLVRILFGSVFLLAISSLFSAYLQKKEFFFSLALAPLFYTGIIAGTLFVFRDRFGLFTVGLGAFLGALIHLFFNVFSFFISGGRIFFCWKKPLRAFKNFFSDFFLRLANNASFQINQSLDILIASFLASGSVMAFSVGSNLGNFLLSVVGLSIGTSAFPKFAKNKGKTSTQIKILRDSLLWVALFSIPPTLFCLLFSQEILQILFRLSGDPLFMTHNVFFWTALSLPLSCSIPVLSRIFLANGDTKTPFLNTLISLFLGTVTAVFFSFFIFEGKYAVSGLSIGSFVATFSSSLLFLLSFWKKIVRIPAS